MENLEIKDVQETKEEVAVDETATIMNEIKEAISQEPIEDPSKKELIKDICELYGICYSFSKDQLQGKALKSKFEQLESNLRKYRNVQEAALDKIRAKKNDVKAKLDKVKREFEIASLDKLDPSRLEKEVLPLEDEYISIDNFCTQKQRQIQGIKHITTKLFAKDKNQIPSIIHAQAVLMCVRILQKVHELMTKENVTDFTDSDKYISLGYKILQNHSIIGSITKDSSIDDIITYFMPVAQHSIDKQANISRESKDVTFKIIDKVCEELNIISLEPSDDSITGLERELMVKANQLKSLETVLRGTKVKNPDGTFSSTPTGSQKSTIMEAMKHASLFLSDASALIDENFIDQLPFRHDMIGSSYKDTVEKFSKTVFGEDCDPVFRRQVVAWVLYSTSIVDKISLLTLYM